MKLQIGVCLSLLAVASSYLLGGMEKVDSSDAGVQVVIDFATSQMNKGMNSMYHHVLLDTPLVTRQVVNGFKYHIYMNLAPTSCRNNGDNLMKTIEECPASDNGQVQQCNVAVYDLRGDLSMLTSECYPKKKAVSEDLLGNDYLDLVPRSKPNNQRKHLLGQDFHDYIPHSILSTGMLGAAKKLNAPSVHRMNILGGDDTDYKIHGGDHCLQYVELFQRFKARYSRVYGGVKEEAKRFQIFCTNMDRVQDYQKMERGTAVYGATIFADISEEEFKEGHTGLKMTGKSTKVPPLAEIPKMSVPDSFDWRDHGAVTAVKNQGSCGSCWAFSTTGNIEGQNAIKNKKLISLSEQELVDCDKIDEGCEGGLPSQAYEALEELGGIEREQDYTYEGYDEKCHFNKSKVMVRVKGSVNISQDEGEMAAWLAENGPISIGINAFAMQFYFGGIAHPWKIFCNPRNLDHGVLIVGYGVDGSEPYWIVKNSWGSGWGRQGYYYVYRGSGVCGLNTMCTSAIVY